MKSQKFIALVLGLSMVAGSSPAMVFAEELPEADQVVAEDAAIDNASEDEADDVVPEEVTIEEIVSADSDNAYGMLKAEGKIGDISWQYYDSGTLVISGSGDMPDFDYASNLPEWSGCQIMTVEIEEGITSIGQDSFFACTYLTEVSIPSSVTSIGTRAFAVCSTLDSVTIPNKVTTIGNDAFHACAALKDISIPYGVTEIGSNAFSDCTSLTSVTIPRSVTTIGDSAFAQCPAVTDVYCYAKPDNLNWVGDNDFKSGNQTVFHVVDVDSYRMKFYNANVTFAAMPCGDNAYCTFDSTKNYLYIDGTGAMYDFVYEPWNGTDTRPWAAYVNGINAVIIGDGITTIGENSFRDEKKITTVNIAASVTNIGDSAFYYCENLENVYFGDNSSLASVGKYAFEDCSKLANIKFEQLSNLKTIGNNAFRCDKLSYVDFPENVTYIGEQAFADNLSLVSVIFGKLNNDLVIGDYAFYDLPITSLVLPSNLISIGNYAFSFCSNLETVAFDENSKLTVIGDDAFYSCYSLGRVYIPASVIEIGNSAFLECNNLKSCVIEANSQLKTIGVAAFNNTALESFTVPKSVTTIGNQAFYYCVKLGTVTIEDGSALTYIGDSAFYYTRIESITIPKTVDYLGYCAFEDCRYLKSVVFCADSNLIRINQSTFYNCEDLENIALPDSITYIGNQAFYSCTSLKVFTIPFSVLEIGSTAFQYCWNLKDVYCYADPDNLYWYGDDDCFIRDHATLCHVYADKRDTFKAEFSDVNVSFVGDLIGMNAGVVLAGHSLSLDGAVGVNFYMELSEVLLSADDPYMLFTLENGSTQKVYVKSQAKADTTTVPGKTLYVFTCRVAAKQMTDEITAQLYREENVPVEGTYTYTVRDYANYILTHNKSYDDSVVTMVKKMLNYGAWSQKYFNYKSGDSDLANALLSNNDKRLNSLPDGALNAYNYQGPKTIGSSSIKFVSANLELESELVMNLYFENVPDGVVIKIDGVDEVTPTKKGDYTVVTITNISAQNLNHFYAVVFYEGDTSFGYVAYAPINYCYNVITRETTTIRTETLKNLITSLYWYYDAARAMN